MRVEDDKEMTFLEHLEVMRGVILKCIAAFFVSFVVVLVFFGYFNSLMMYPLKSAKRILAAMNAPSPESIKPEDQKLGPVYLVKEIKNVEGEFEKQGPFYIVPSKNGVVLKSDPAETAWYDTIKLRAMTFATPIIVWFYVGFLGGLGFSLPIMLYFIARFIAPGLKPEELKMLRPAIIAGSLLFGAGAVFAFSFILPMGIAVMSYMAQSMMLEMFPDAQSYYAMVIFITLAIGLTFELPMLEVLLIYIGVLDPAWLRRNRKIVFFLILVFAAIITPPDIITQLSITIPLYLMYEVALVIGERARKRKLRRDAEEEKRQQTEDEAERKQFAKEQAERKALEADENNDDSEDSVDDEDVDVDKSVYGEDSYNEYPYDPYNYDDENYDPDNDPYGLDPYVAERKAPRFSPNWELNRPDTSFMSPKWELNEDDISETNQTENVSDNVEGNSAADAIKTSEDSLGSSKDRNSKDVSTHLPQKKGGADENTKN